MNRPFLSPRVGLSKTLAIILTNRQAATLLRSKIVDSLLGSFLICLFSFLFAVSSVAQTTADPSYLTGNTATGVMPYGPYAGVNEQVNLSNGNVNFQLPLLNLSQRAGGTFTLGVQLDTKLYSLQTGEFAPDWWTTYWQKDTRAPMIAPYLRLSVPTLETKGGVSTAFPYCRQTWIFTSSDGGKHSFSGLCANPTDNIRDSADGSFIRLNISNTSDIVVRLKDGTAIHFYGYVGGTFPTGNYYPLRAFDLIVDTNGNEISATNTSGVLTAIKDSVGRTITIDLTNHTIGYKDSYGMDRQISLTSVTPLTVGQAITFAHPVQGECTVGPGETDSAAEHFAAGNTAWTLTLPDGDAGLTYRFDFNQIGEILRIGYPSGGYTSYEYQSYQNAWSNSGHGILCSAVDVREIAAKHECRKSDGNCGSSTTPEDTTTYQASGLYNFTNTAMDVYTPDASGIPNKTHHVTAIGPYPNYSARETDQYIYSGSSTLLRTIHTDFYPSNSSISDSSLPIRVTTTLNDISPALSSKAETDYLPITGLVCGSGVTVPPFIDNPQEFREYAYGLVLVRKTDYTWLTSTNYDVAHTHILDRMLTQKVLTSAGTQMSLQTNEYDNYTEGLTSSAATQHLTMTTNRGNVTAISNWLNTTGASLTTRSQYDDAGNVRKTTDPLLNSTSISFTDNWTDNSCAPLSGQAAAYPKTITNQLGQTTTTAFLSCTGLVGSTKDANLNTTTYTYDPVGRTVSVAYPIGNTNFSYSDAAPVSLTINVNISASSILSSTQIHDGFGRKVQNQLTSDPEGTDFVDISYDPMGHVVATTNPYRSTSDPTFGTTNIIYDTLGRPTKTIPPDGTVSANYISASYSGNCTTSSDQAGKSRKKCFDALGRLTQVFEDPSGSNYETDYSYDALNNLLSVSQKGGSTNSANWRPRSFSYNSLSQLTSVVNPESGTTSYTYDSNGNLLTKTSPKPNQIGSATVIATYTHDALGRLTQKSFNDGSTPTIKYGYDNVSLTGCTTTPPTLTITNPIGLRTAMCDGGGAEAWSYDSMGRPLLDTRITNSVSKTVTYTYNLDGSTQSVSVPTFADGSHPLTAAYTPGGAGRSLSMKNNGSLLLNAAHYTPSGALCYLQGYWNGNFTTTASFNPRLQPVTNYTVHQFSGTAPAPCAAVTPLPNDGVTSNVLYLTNSFTDASGHNNGDVASITNTLVPTRSQVFTYDALDRISTAHTTSNNTTSHANCWGEQYSYDPWGNLLAITPDSAYAGCVQESGFNYTTLTGTNNRLLSGSGYTYDAAGNVITGPLGAIYTYDAENHLTSTAGVNYTYDGDGKRVMKSGAPGTIYWYGAGSDVLMETNLTNNIQYAYEFFNGQRQVRISATNEVNFYFADHLGTARSTYTLAGNDESDFYPFGGERVISAGTATHYKFTGEERDSESGNDYFGARYYSGITGRWLAPDLINLTNDRVTRPGTTLNKYVYAANNPLKFVDRDGEDITFFYRPPNGIFTWDFGHLFLVAVNQNTNQVGVLDYGPVGKGNGPGRINSNLNARAADIKSGKFITFTIQTTPEVADKILRLMKALQDGSPQAYEAFHSNCTTICQDVVKDLGLNFGEFYPRWFFYDLLHKYNPNAFLNLKYTGGQFQTGRNYGFPRDVGMDYSDWLLEMYSRQAQQQGPSPSPNPNPPKAPGKCTGCP